MVISESPESGGATMTAHLNESSDVNLSLRRRPSASLNNQTVPDSSSETSSSEAEYLDGDLSRGEGAPSNGCEGGQDRRHGAVEFQNSMRNAERIENVEKRVESDSRFVNRPSVPAHHRIKESPLSSDAIFKQSHAGLFNLCIVVLVAVNGRLIIENIMKYGWLIRTGFWFSSRSLRDWPLFMCCLTLPIFPLAAFLFEKLAKKNLISEPVVVLLHVLNTTAAVLYPVLVILRCDSAIMFGVTLMLFACIVWLKLVSYAHTNYDMRALVKAVEKGLIECIKFVYFVSLRDSHGSYFLLSALSVIFLASDIPVLKEVEAIVDPASFTVVRFVVSAIPFLPFVLKSRGDIHTRNAGIELGFWVSLGYLMQAVGLLTSDAGRSSFISILTVIVVPLLDGMLGATVPTHTWFGALMSIIGVAMLESSGSPPSVGDLLNFLSAVFFGVHMLRTEHISRATHKKKFLPLLGFEVCVIALFSTIWYFAQGWFGGWQDSSPSSWTCTMFWDWMVTFPWIPALYTGIFSTGLCLWIEMAAMRDVSATETAIIYGLEPVWGAGFAWFLLGERWGAIGWVGAALVLGGSLIVQVLASSASQSVVNEERIERADLLSDKKNGLSTTPVVISSKESANNLSK